MQLFKPVRPRLRGFPCCTGDMACHAISPKPLLNAFVEYLRTYQALKPNELSMDYITLEGEMTLTYEHFRGRQPAVVVRFNSTLVTFAGALAAHSTEAN